MKGDRIVLALAGLSLAGTAVAYLYMPETIPLHWSMTGEIDGWGPRASILALGALPLGFALLFRLLPRIDPLRASYSRHAKAYAKIGRLTVLGLAALAWASIAAALGLDLDTGALVRALVGLLLIGLGNFMGNLKRNFFVGIKTPWALADDEVWRLTHRRGALVFVAMGAVYLLSAAIPPGPLLAVVATGSTTAGVAYVFLYSYLCWRRLRGPGASPRAGDAAGTGGAGPADDSKRDRP